MINTPFQDKVKEAFQTNHNFVDGFTGYRVYFSKWYYLNVVDWMNVFEQMDFQEINFSRWGESASWVYYQFGCETKVGVQYFSDFIVSLTYYQNKKNRRHDLLSFLEFFLEHTSVNQEAKNTLAAVDPMEREAIDSLFHLYLKARLQDRLRQVFQEHNRFSSVKFYSEKEHDVYVFEGQVRNFPYQLQLRETEACVVEIAIHQKEESGKRIFEEATAELCQIIYLELEEEFREIGFVITSRYAQKLLPRMLADEIRTYYRATKEYRLKKAFSSI